MFSLASWATFSATSGAVFFCNKDLSALLQKKTAPDVAEKVAQEAKENIQIHGDYHANC